MKFTAKSISVPSVIQIKADLAVHSFLPCLTYSVEAWSASLTDGHEKKGKISTVQWLHLTEFTHTDWYVR